MAWRTTLTSKGGARNNRGQSCVAQLVYDQGAGEGPFLKPCAHCPRSEDKLLQQSTSIVGRLSRVRQKDRRSLVQAPSMKCLTSIVILNSAQLSMCGAEAREFPTSAASQPDTRTTQIRTFTTSMGTHPLLHQPPKPRTSTTSTSQTLYTLLFSLRRCF